MARASLSRSFIVATAATLVRRGGVPERSNGAVLKTAESSGLREFKSHPRRSSPSAPPSRGRNREGGVPSSQAAGAASAVGQRTLVGAGHESAERDDFRAVFPIEAHDG